MSNGLGNEEECLSLGGFIRSVAHSGHLQHLNIHVSIGENFMTIFPTLERDHRIVLTV